MYSILAWSAENGFDFWGYTPSPVGGTYDASPDPLVVRGFLPSAFAGSGLRRLQVPDSHVLVGTPASRSNFFPPDQLTPFLDPPPVYNICGADELKMFL